MVIGLEVTTYLAQILFTIIKPVCDWIRVNRLNVEDFFMQCFFVLILM